MIVFCDKKVWDFLLLHALVTFVMTAKELFIGSVVSNGAKGSLISACVGLMILFSIIPTLSIATLF